MLSTPSFIQLPDTSRVSTDLPSAEKATEVTPSEWPTSLCSAAPLAASQSRIVLSSNPDTTDLPSGEKATELTPSEWPSSICSAPPVAASQSRTVLSKDPDTTDLPSGEKATEALDECDKDDAIKVILQCLAELNNQETTRLRVFITSRPELPIRLGFRKIPQILHHHLVLHDVPLRIVDGDITIYFREELDGIQLDAHTISRLIQKASGLFIWAATACRFIKKGTHFASERLSLVLEGGTGERNPERELDQIYSKILSDSINEDHDEHEKEQLFELFKRIVGTIVILFNPLSAVALGSLLDSCAPGMKQTKINVEEMLKNLHSVLVIPKSNADAIRLFHPSFRDFLLAKGRCQNTKFWVDEEGGHRMLVDCCIRLMATSLKQDICGLHVPGIILANITSSQVHKYLHPELQYACLYWIDHLQKSNVQLHDSDQVHQFLEVHLLHWLEALACLGKGSEGILAVLSLEAYIKVSRS